MRYCQIPNSLFVKNRKRFIEKLPSNSMAIFVSNEKMPRNGDQFYPFRQQSDFFYLTGIEVEKATLILFPDCPLPQFREVLFVESYNETKAIWEGGLIAADEAKKVSGITEIKVLEIFNQIVHELMTYAETVFLNSYEYTKYQSDVETKQQRFNKKLKEKYPLHQYRRAAPILEELRTVKMEEEIQLIQTAIDITGKAFDRSMRFVEPKKYEFEVQAEIEHTFTTNRATGHAYPPIVAGGINGCCLHYSENNDILNDNELLLFDIGAEYANYSADLSRTIPINGKFTKRQKDCYNAVLRTMKKVKKLYVEGNTIEQINQATWNLMEKEMIGLGLFTEQDVKNQNPASPLYRNYLMHGIAHHIGLDVHDVGARHTPLKAGMVLTCEPGIYIREEKIGIRIENDILVTKTEPIDLMKNVPIEIDEIEAIMSKR